MGIGIPGFVPERLVEARAARRIASKSALARLMSVTPSTVGRWEDGSSSPDPAMWDALAQTLRVRREYFLRPVMPRSRPMFYRTLSSTLARDIEYQHGQMAWLKDISAAVQHYVDLPAVDIPDVMGTSSYKQLRDDDLEQIAVELRRHWGLGEGPCADVVSVMERVGIVVSSIEMGTAKLDGLCNWSEPDGRPHVLLATDKMSFVRRQMDAAHELAHAVLHRDVTEEDLRKDLKEIERQAFRLASAFLLPGTIYPREVVRPSLAMLHTLKERWRVSIKAQIRRLEDLAIITSEYARELYKLYSAKGWNREEPMDRQWAVPEPRVLADAMTVIVESGVRTKADLMSVEFTIPAGDVENLANLHPGWFEGRTGEVVQLKREVQPAEARGQAGAVLPFSRRR